MKYKYRGKIINGGTEIDGRYVAVKNDGTVIIGGSACDSEMMVDGTSVVRIDEDGNRERLLFTSLGIDQSPPTLIGVFQDVFKDELSLLHRSLTVIEYTVLTLRMLSAFCKDQESRQMAKEVDKLADELDEILNGESGE